MADPAASARGKGSGGKGSGRKRAQPATPAGDPPRPLRPLRSVLPALSTAQAAALRSFFATPQTWSLSGNGLLQFIPGRPAPAAQTFELDAEGTRLGLALQAPAHGEGPHWSDYQGRSRVLAWRLAHESQLMRPSGGVGVVEPRLADAGDAAQDEASLLWLDFIVDED